MLLEVMVNLWAVLKVNTGLVKARSGKLLSHVLYCTCSTLVIALVCSSSWPDLSTRLKRTAKDLHIEEKT